MTEIMTSLGITQKQQTNEILKKIPSFWSDSVALHVFDSGFFLSLASSIAAGIVMLSESGIFLKWFHFFEIVLKSVNGLTRFEIRQNLVELAHICF